MAELVELQNVFDHDGVFQGCTVLVGGKSFDEKNFIFIFVETPQNDI
jgi:hypothetical protein